MPTSGISDSASNPPLSEQRMTDLPRCPRTDTKLVALWNHVAQK
jgi:hypothetical protein